MSYRAGEVVWCVGQFTKFDPKENRRYEARRIRQGTVVMDMEYPGPIVKGRHVLVSFGEDQMGGLYEPCEVFKSWRAANEAYPDAEG